MYLFREQFKLNESESCGIRDVCIFIVNIYINYWFESASGPSASRNDLQLLKDLKSYEKINKPIAAIALKKFLGHLWYLSEELVAFAFFDDKVSHEVKKKMVNALSIEGEDSPVKRITVDENLLHSKSLEHFVTNNTLRFFSITGIKSGFLKKEVEDWEEDADFKLSRELVRSMKVVNDIAERGVALMQEYNKLHTHNEEQKQFLLLLVKEFRQKYPDSNKSTLCK